MEDSEYSQQFFVAIYAIFLPKLQDISLEGCEHNAESLGAKDISTQGHLQLTISHVMFIVPHYFYPFADLVALS